MRESRNDLNLQVAGKSDRLNTTLQSSSVWNDDTLDAHDYYERLAPDGTMRPHWSMMTEQLESVGMQTLRARSASIEQFVRENGVTFHADETPDQSNRPWQLSLVPSVLGSAEWKSLCDGLTGRTRLLEKVLSDLLGEQRLIREGIIPGELLWANPSFNRTYHDLEKSQQKLHIAATDLARGSDGIWRECDGNASLCPPTKRRSR